MLKVNYTTLATFVCSIGLLLSLSSVFATADEWFDSYGKIPWKEERLRLDNFAIFLHRNPDMIGYVAYYAGRGENSVKIKKDVKRAKNYLIQERKIDHDRIVIVDAGMRSGRKIVLQPVLRNGPPPKF